MDLFLKQDGEIELITDLAAFNRKLLLTVKRTVNKDATISFDSSLYETDMFLAGERLDVKYDPDAKSGIHELYLYRGDVPFGTARLVNYNDNAKRKRTGGKAGQSNTDKKPAVHADTDEALNESAWMSKENTISYLDVMLGGES